MSTDGDIVWFVEVVEVEWLEGIWLIVATKANTWASCNTVALVTLARNSTNKLLPLLAPVCSPILQLGRFSLIPAHPGEHNRSLHPIWLQSHPDFSLFIQTGSNVTLFSQWRRYHITCLPPPKAVTQSSNQRLRLLVCYTLWPNNPTAAGATDCNVPLQQCSNQTPDCQHPGGARCSKTTASDIRTWHIFTKGTHIFSSRSSSHKACFFQKCHRLKANYLDITVLLLRSILTITLF